ncbi:hypothetical protein GCM10011506_47340 [Marivirga lumbricoides]|uniref:SPOR domain-containing protein n=1 Tax=Marivirga lumbricoides TaxID=1046115 RepID=A0ABQ1NA53_9BACT|nr:hypothetical protein GCM10011506_47340 [Marivirga lumbricoides]
MNIKTTPIVLFFLTVVLSFNLNGQTPILSGLNKVVLSNNEEVECSLPLLSGDGQILYFVKTFSENNIGGIKGGQDIWFSHRIDSTTWQTATNLEALNNVYNNMVIGVSSITNTLYLLNTYSSPNRWKYSIAVSTLTEDSSWSEPRELDIKFDADGDFRSFYTLPDEELIFLSAEGKSTLGKEDIYVYYKEGDSWAGPVSLGENINTQGSEIAPFYSPDLKALFYSSNGREGFGDFDIYMVRKTGDQWNDWSEPINLGETVNSNSFDAYLSTYPSGETFFVSNRSGKAATIFRGNLSFLEEEIPEPVDSTEYLTPAPDSLIVQDSLPEYYVVQVLAMPTGRAPKAGFFDNLGDVKIEMSGGRDGLERYYLGRYETLKEAISRKNEVVKMGYYDAFVRAIMKYAEF